MTTNRIIIGFFAAILVVTMYQTFRTPVVPEREMPKPAQACEGEPIVVPYDYTGAINEPHDCKVQCETGVQHYILYTNGIGTQCEPLPGCNDWGEDNGETCTPPEVSTAS